MDLKKFLNNLIYLYFFIPTIELMIKKQINFHYNLIDRLFYRVFQDVINLYYDLTALDDLQKRQTYKV